MVEQNLSNTLDVGVFWVNLGVLYEVIVSLGRIYNLPTEEGGEVS